MTGFFWGRSLLGFGLFSFLGSAGLGGWLIISRFSGCWFGAAIDGDGGFIR